MAGRTSAFTEPGENGIDGISVQHGDVYNAVLRLWLWSAFPAGTGCYHFLCRLIFRDSDDILQLVVGQIQVWAG